MNMAAINRYEILRLVIVVRGDWLLVLSLLLQHSYNVGWALPILLI